MKEPKSRVITFRLTAEEYALLKDACGAEQTSVSAVARRMVVKWAEALRLPPRTDKQLGEIASRLDMLEKLLKQDRIDKKILP